MYLKRSHMYETNFGFSIIYFQMIVTKMTKNKFYCSVKSWLVDGEDTLT